MVKSKTGDNIHQYIKWRQDLSFENDKFNEIDGLVISQLTFLELMIEETKEGPKPLKEALKPYLKMDKKQKINLGLIIPKDCLTLANEISKAKRYENGLVSDFEKQYDKEKTEQFCALTYHIDDNKMVIAYQGTDDTIIGWQENLNMMDKYPIAAQNEAVNYLNKMHNSYPYKDIIIVGHSKGGNLAVYSGVYANDDTVSKIIKIYNYDGPGFEKGRLEEEKVEKIKSKVRNILPYHSTVGMIFNQIGKITTVLSNEKGLMQHNGFSWMIENKKFIRRSLSNDSIKFNNDLNEFLRSLNDDERKSLLESFAVYLSYLPYKTLVELSHSGFAAVMNINKIPKKERQIIGKFIRIFIKDNMIQGNK